MGQYKIPKLRIGVGVNFVQVSSITVLSPLMLQYGVPVEVVNSTGTKCYSEMLGYMYFKSFQSRDSLSTFVTSSIVIGPYHRLY